VLADSGYCSEDNLRETAELGVEAYIAVGKQKHNQPPPPAPRGRIPQSATLRDRMRRKLQTVEGHEICSRRKTILEPVYGQIKPARGFRQFLVRGIEKVQGAWALVCTGHNLLKLPGRSDSADCRIVMNICSPLTTTSSVSRASAPPLKR
jgi:hypothetical protein